MGCRALAAGVAFACVALAARAEDVPTGVRLYETTCAVCHGLDGRGEPGRAALSMDLPDFTDCSFVTREPDADFFAVVHEGGPVRGFAEAMPGHGHFLGEAQIRSLLAVLRSFCRDPRWPRGELNLPRPLFTEKAYPEDEALVTATANLEDEDRVEAQLVYERRIGPRSQIELALPFEWVEPTGEASRAGVGDAALAAKHVLWHDIGVGAIASAGAEVRLPTGDEDRGLGTGTVVFEPFLAWGQILPADSFVQLEAKGELPVDAGRADAELRVSAALGASFAEDRYGRVWSPMLEVIGTAAFPKGGGSDLAWDLVPQVQVTLSRRQHVRLAAGVRLPVTDADERPAEAAVYLLWDWFDGGLLEGW
jgi:mono/diheme cytochrome c family protein